MTKKLLSTPIWITNFKNYETSTGDAAVSLAKIHEKVAQELGVSIGVCVSALDVYRVSQAVSIPVFSQHADPIEYGKHTGSILPSLIKNSGAMGTLLNHSEKRIDDDIRQESIQKIQKEGLSAIMCAENPEEIRHLSGFQPDMLAFEPPELIGSKTASVSSAHPQSIQESVRASNGIPVLVGAGISSVKDVEVALSLGASGFLVATAITKSDDPETALKAFVSAF